MVHGEAPIKFSFSPHTLCSFFFGTKRYSIRKEREKKKPEREKEPENSRAQSKHIILQMKFMLHQFDLLPCCRDLWLSGDRASTLLLVSALHENLLIFSNHQNLVNTSPNRVESEIKLI